MNHWTEPDKIAGFPARSSLTNEVRRGFGKDFFGYFLPREESNSNLAGLLAHFFPKRSGRKIQGKTRRCLLPFLFEVPEFCLSLPYLLRIYSVSSPLVVFFRYGCHSGGVLGIRFPWIPGSSGVVQPGPCPLLFKKKWD